MPEEAYPAEGDPPPMRASSRVLYEGAGEHGFANWSEVPPMPRTAVRKLREQYSHAISREDLAGHSRLGGGSERAQSAAKLYVCARCQAEAQPPARPIAAVPKWTRHNQCMGVDFFSTPDMKDISMCTR